MTPDGVDGFVNFSVCIVSFILVSGAGCAALLSGGRRNSEESSGREAAQTKHNFGVKVSDTVPRTAIILIWVYLHAAVVRGA